MMPDEVDFYKDCPNLESKVRRLQSALRSPGDIALLDDVAEFICLALSIAERVEREEL